jgi:hypothetical protein
MKDLIANMTDGIFYHSSSTSKTNGATRKRGTDIRLPGRVDPTIVSLSAEQPLLSPVYAPNGRPMGNLCPWVMAAHLMGMWTSICDCSHHLVK